MSFFLRHRVVSLGVLLLVALMPFGAASASGSAAPDHQPVHSWQGPWLHSEDGHGLLAAALHPGPARWVAPLQPRVAGVANSANSSNWSGQIASGSTFNSVTGDWVVPPVKRTTTFEASTTWIGIDGGASSPNSILQTGTAQLTRGGANTYYAWYEIFPSPTVELYRVSPGDHMGAVISQVSGTDWSVTITDQTSGKTFAGPLTYTGPGDSAEWIEELPTTTNPPQPYLANFGSVQFTQTAFTALPRYRVSPIDMVDGGGNVIAQTGSRSSGSFTITYVPEPTTTAVSANPATSSSGTPVTYSATVGSAGPPPTGTVTFADGSTTLCTAKVSGGRGSCTATNTPQGAGVVQGSYSGDANSTSSSGTAGVNVLAPPPRPQHGYWLVGSDGGIFTFGSAQFYGSTGNLHLQRPVVGITPTRDRGGYWLDASDGGIFAFGDAGFYGSIPGLGLAPAGSGIAQSLNAPIVAMVPSADGRGYFMVASDGGVFAFGDARFAGSCPGIGGCAGAAVAVMPDASGNGYWLVTQSGNVYAFGDAPFYGSPGQQSVPVTSAVRTPDGRGYWILFANGAIASYGDAAEFGMPAGQMGGVNPATAIFPTSDGGGYWVAAADGAVANFGDAPNDGSMLGTSLNGSIIAGTGW